jgi:hypothetical protein
LNRVRHGNVGELKLDHIRHLHSAWHCSRTN